MERFSIYFQIFFFNLHAKLASVIALITSAAALPVNNEDHPIFGAFNGLFQANQLPNMQSIPNFGDLFRNLNSMFSLPDISNLPRNAAAVSASASASDSDSSVSVRQVIRT